jgi:hypothetical protein
LQPDALFIIKENSSPVWIWNNRQKWYKGVPNTRYWKSLYDLFICWQKKIVEKKSGIFEGFSGFLVILELLLIRF